MKRCLSLVMLALAMFAPLSITTAWAAPSHATLTRVKRTHQRGTRRRMPTRPESITRPSGSGIAPVLDVKT